ncbi:hypothetical protein ACFU9B_41820 [Streptomyces sp. NPDC057592]|uniref:ATP-dependent DNA ligase n=1 Tax=unclassified Streptomyces TaxID=2593676 RepID=UPI00368E1F53
MALAQAVPVLPEGPGWWYEPKLDGHRTVLRRTDETVVLYARSGRVVTQHWMDLAVAGMELRPGTVLDGEAVIWRDGRLNFAAAQARAASSVARARALAARYPASYVCWDVLQHPDPAIGDCRSRPYTERPPSACSSSPMSGRRSRPCQPATTGTLPCSGTTPCVRKALKESSAKGAERAIRRDGAGGRRSGTRTPPTPWSSDSPAPGGRQLPRRPRPGQGASETRPRPLLPSPRALRTVTDVGRSGRRRPPPDCCASRSTCRPAATRRRRASHCCP